MTQKTAAELARCYLTSHGAKCDKVGYRSFYFIFRRRRFLFMLRLNPYSQHRYIDMKPTTGHWFGVNLEYHNIDIADPTFDPEEFFQPFLIKLETFIRSNRGLHKENQND